MQMEIIIAEARKYLGAMAYSYERVMLAREASYK